MHTISSVYSSLVKRVVAQSKLLVWALWFVMVSAALACVVLYGRNIPLAEDWLLVAPFTGNEPDFWGWVWAQNNEHRVPLPRLMLLGLMWLTQGDFRAGMVCNVLILAAVAAGMIKVANHLRGGQTKLVDAFFPLVLLHLGNWENMVWSWQLSFVVPTALIFVVLLLIVSQKTLATPVSAVLLGIIVVLLPLCGANGLLLVPFLAFWCGVSGIAHWRNRNHNRWISIVLLVTPLIALSLIAIYFVDYQRPTWNPPSPGLGATLETGAKFLAFGFGAGVRRFWPLAVFVTFAILSLTVGLLVQAVLRQKADERLRTVGVFLFLGNLFLVALAVGWGRAALVPEYGIPMRYALLSAPTLCLSFFAWELYGSNKYRRIIQQVLLLLICLLLPLNTLAGSSWRHWYVQGMKSVERDLYAKVPYSIVAKDHNEFLIHWWDESKLEAHMEMLRDVDNSPFSAQTEDAEKN